MFVISTCKTMSNTSSINSHYVFLHGRLQMSHAGFTHMYVLCAVEWISLTILRVWWIATVNPSPLSTYTPWSFGMTVCFSSNPPPLIHPYYCKMHLKPWDLLSWSGLNQHVCIRRAGVGIVIRCNAYSLFLKSSYVQNDFNCMNMRYYDIGMHVMLFHCIFRCIALFVCIVIASFYYHFT